jgi:putative FmdB family regulatory protein
VRVLAVWKDRGEMPTYEYECRQCGEPLEVVQAFTDDALTTCPSCGGVLKKVFGNIGIVFKGSGFYKTDSRSGSSASKGSAAETSSSNGSDSKSDTKADSKSESSSESKSETKKDSPAKSDTKSDSKATQSGSSSSTSSTPTPATSSPKAAAAF